MSPSRTILKISKEARPVGGSRNSPVARAELEDLEFGIDQHAGGRVLIDHEAVGFALGADGDGNIIGGGGARGLERRGPRKGSGRRCGKGDMEARGGGEFTDEDFLLFVDGAEQFSESTDGFTGTRKR